MILNFDFRDKRASTTGALSESSEKPSGKAKNNNAEGESSDVNVDLSQEVGLRSVLYALVSITVIELSAGIDQQGSLEEPVHDIEKVEEESEVFILISGDEQGDQQEGSPEQKSIEEEINEKAQIDVGDVTISSVSSLDDRGSSEEDSSVEDVGSISRSELTSGFDFLHSFGF